MRSHGPISCSERSARAMEEEALGSQVLLMQGASSLLQSLFGFNLCFQATTLILVELAEEKGSSTSCPGMQPVEEPGFPFGRPQTSHGAPRWDQPGHREPAAAQGAVFCAGPVLPWAGDSCPGPCRRDGAPPSSMSQTRLRHPVSAARWCGRERGSGTPAATPPAKGAAGSAVSVAAGMHCSEHN